MNELLYVRHGKTKGNEEKLYIGQTESPLTEEGVAGAHRVGQALHDMGKHIDAIYCSHLSRQFDTAKIIAEAIGLPVERIHLNDLLLERSGGKFEGTPQRDFFALSEQEQIEGGAESFADLAQRATAMVAFANEHYPDQTVLFVGSAAIGEMMRAIIKYGDYTRMFDDGPMPNTEVIRLI